MRRKEHQAKIVGDTRDPFLVKQIEEAKAERNKERKLKEKYAKEINEVATYLGCYGHSRAIINTIKKYKQSHYDLENMKNKRKIRFLIVRFYNYLIRKWAW